MEKYILKQNLKYKSTFKGEKWDHVVGDSHLNTHTANTYEFIIIKYTHIVILYVPTS